jgi:hypothetical protein
MISNTSLSSLKHSKTLISKLLKDVVDLVALTKRIILTSIKIKLSKLLANLKKL